MPAHLVVDSAPTARNSPYSRVSMWACCVRRMTDLGLELCELEASAVELEDVDCLGRVGLRVCGGRCLDVGRVLSLGACQGVRRRRGWTGSATLQFLHFQTKLASPRLPLISFCSKRLTETKLGCVSRHDVHCTLNV
jgi:hypothetical protein